MKKMFVVVFLVMAVMIVAGCQSGETLAGQATKSETAECKANKDCKLLFDACSAKQQCAPKNDICKKDCATQFKGGKAIGECMKTKCTPPFQACLNTCYDQAIAQGKAGAIVPVTQAKCVDPDKTISKLKYTDQSFSTKTSASAGTVTAEDRCVTEGNEVGSLWEYYCEDSSNIVKPLSVRCSAVDGKVCHDGACVNELKVGESFLVEGTGDKVLLDSIKSYPSFSTCLFKVNWYSPGSYLPNSKQSIWVSGVPVGTITVKTVKENSCIFTVDVIKSVAGPNCEAKGFFWSGKECFGKCIDNDSGINLVSKGFTSGYNPNSGKYETMTDSCIAKTVNEVWCDKNQLAWGAKDCPAGTSCQDGACK